MSKIEVNWSSAFAYLVGIIATDGSLSKDGRHIDITSKDRQLLAAIKVSLEIKNKIGRKARGGSIDKKYFRIQLGDRSFYKFLLSIGITPAKSKTIGQLKIPVLYFNDFLRGCIDGDGSIGVTRHPESKWPQLRLRVYSASNAFLCWLKEQIAEIIEVQGGHFSSGKRVRVLSYGKQDSTKVLKFVYYPGATIFLKRKYRIAQPFLRV